MGGNVMKENDLFEAVRSLLASDGATPRSSFAYTPLAERETEDDDDADEFGEDFLIPDDADGELRDVLIELNVTTHEYIRKAVEHHGGRLRQQEIAELTGWSEPTVSQKLSEMEEEGIITRFRTGREKIVCLPDESPEDPDAPSQ